MAKNRMVGILKSLVAAALCLMLFAWLGNARAAEPLVIHEGWLGLPNLPEQVVFRKPDILRHYGKAYKVDFVHFTGTSAELTALATGDVNICTLAYSSLASAIINAHLGDLRVVADGFQDGHDGYFSTAYLVRNNSGIKRIKDLKGKVIAVNVIGAAVDVAARAVLLEHGLVARRDYTIVEAPFPTMGPMLAQHKVDLIVGVPPFIYEPKLAAISHPLFRMKQGMGSSQMIMIVAREGYLRQHRAAMQDYFDDMVRGVHWMLNPQNRPAVIRFVSRMTHVPPKILDGYYLTKKDFYHQPNAIPDIKALQRNIDTQYKLGFIKEKIDVRKYVDLSFVRRAAAREAAK